MSDPTKIPRPDAKLKRLPEEVQAHIVEMCGLPNITQKHILEWILAECDVQSSPAALSEFLSWHAARQEARQDEARVDAYLDEERQLHPEWSDEQLFERGQRMFSLLAISKQDPKAWTSVQREDRERLLARTTREKFEFDAAKACLRHLPFLKQISAHKGMTEEEKVQAVRKRLWGTPPGAVQI